MRISQIGRALPGASRRRHPSPAPERDGLWQRALRAEGAETAWSPAPPRPRALHAVRAEDARPVRARPYLPFIAQLAAGRIGLPQTRQRRRASPGDAREGYETAGHLSTAPHLGTRRMRAL